MKFFLVMLALCTAAQSFAYEVRPRADGYGYYVVCANGNSGGKYPSKSEADSHGKELCRGRGEFSEANRNKAIEMHAPATSNPRPRPESSY